MKKVIFLGLTIFNLTIGECMTDYIDSMGFYHDKKSATSNNKFIYSAYAKKVGLLTQLTSEMQTELDHCFTHRVRHSFRPTSVISRDEILGMVYLDPRLADRLIMDDFNFSPYPIPKFNIITLIKQVIEVKDKHRNYFWQNGLSQIYRFAFSLPIQDREIGRAHV